MGKLNKLEISFKDLRYFIERLKSNGCTPQRSREIITKYHKYITPEVISDIKFGRKSIYDFIAPEGAYHDM